MVRQLQWRTSIKKIKVTVRYLTVAVVLSVGICIAAAEEFPQSLPIVESALGLSESTLAGIDVGALSVQYREGQFIENTRTSALKLVQARPPES